MNRSLTAILLFLCLPHLTAEAQVDTPQNGSRAKIGLTAGMNFSWHQGTYTSGDAQFDCCTFTGGNGLGRVVGIRIFLPFNDRLLLRSGLMFEQINGQYPVEYQAYPVLDRNDQVVLLHLSEELETTLETFSIELMPGYMLLPPVLYVTAGPAYSILMSRHQQQKETIVSPSDFMFMDGSGRSHMFIDSEIGDAEHFLSFRAGAGAVFVLTPVLYGNSEILFTVPLSDVRAAGGWSVSGFEFTFGVFLVL